MDRVSYLSLFLTLQNVDHDHSNNHKKGGLMTAFANTDVAAQVVRTKYRWVVLAVIVVVCMLAAADRANIGIALPYIQKEFGATNAQAGLLVSAFFLFYSLGQIPAGFLLSRVGVRMVAPISIGLTSEKQGVTDKLHDALSDIDQASLRDFLGALIRTHVVHAPRRLKEVEEAERQLRASNMPVSVLPGVRDLFQRTAGQINSPPLDTTTPTLEQAFE
jgi:hypothetical protein